MAPTQNVTLYVERMDPVSKVVVDYMWEHSGCKVETHYLDDISKIEVTKKTGVSKFPQIIVGNKYFGGVECMNKFPLDVTEYRLMEINGTIDEPMCKEENEFDRLILFNGKSEHEWADMYTLYKKEIASFWVVEEMDLVDDLTHWAKLKEEEKHFITMVLAFFASLDQLVMENVSINFGQEIAVPQVRSHFAAQECMESIHGEAYALLIQTYIKDKKEQSRVLRSVQSMPIIEKKARSVTKWMDAEKVSLAERLIGFTCLEGVQFSGAFCAIFWFKKRGLLPGLCFSNALISRDEGLHAEASVMIYNKLETRLPEERVHEIFKESVDMEKEFICESLPVSLLGINSDSMASYIEYVADFWLKKLKYDPLYDTKNPFEWMEMQGLQGQSNFFELRVSEYSKANVMVDPKDQEFSLEADF